MTAMLYRDMQLLFFIDDPDQAELPQPGYFHISIFNLDHFHALTKSLASLALSLVSLSRDTTPAITRTSILTPIPTPPRREGVGRPQPQMKRRTRSAKNDNKVDVPNLNQQDSAYMVAPSTAQSSASTPSPSSAPEHTMTAKGKGKDKPTDIEAPEVVRRGSRDRHPPKRFIDSADLLSESKPARGRGKGGRGGSSSKTKK